MKTLNQAILNLIEVHGKEHVEDSIMTRFNVRDAEIDEEGDIWISDPCRGHWLTEGNVKEFLTWVE